MIDTELFTLIESEKKRQINGIELIASENFTSQDVLYATGSILTNKYAEGYPGKRYYGGCQIVDQIEQLAIDRAKELFQVQFANVQPHSGSQANTAVYSTFLKPHDSILGFDLAHGGHLTHGSPVNFSGLLYDAHFYGVGKESNTIDYDLLESKAKSVKPKLIIAGASAYPRDIDYEAFRNIAEKVGATLLADISHPAGLIAAGLLNNPFPHCHVVTTTTHKTLRGPRGGVILMHKDYENPFGLKFKNGNLRKMSHLINMAVFPGNQGGPLIHSIAGKAVAFKEAQTKDFKVYAKQIQNNAKVLADALIKRDYHLVSGGTDNHLVLIDLRNKNITGKQAEETLEKIEITVNKNMVPFDDQSPFVTSGIRIGTPAMTTRGLKENHMDQIVDFIDRGLTHRNDESELNAIALEVKKFISPFPLVSQ
ncbi:MAG: serine hydroxymethyltransferase [Flavobacteriaceae bacterium]|nr:serine hydroxymethyltransferase [Flavobacteriaceae bacterium]MCY4266293.1 serine hydroxymethyltransferase [Flavobacteriaceae bacterium]MCY4299810.1 serine hydroxymethyltransferase [Flavobacteriaceae bacterium]